jgi:hypothetical protein
MAWYMAVAPAVMPIILRSCRRETAADSSVMPFTFVSVKA